MACWKPVTIQLGNAAIEQNKSPSDIAGDLAKYFLKRGLSIWLRPESEQSFTFFYESGTDVIVKEIFLNNFGIDIKLHEPKLIEESNSKKRWWNCW
jgi:hypothetical protein